MLDAPCGWPRGCEGVLVQSEDENLTVGLGMLRASLPRLASGVSRPSHRMAIAIAHPYRPKQLCVASWSYELVSAAMTEKPLDK
eukprot:scaffold135228_cov35-Tisochrysis_lutea.AAC.1